MRTIVRASIVALSLACCASAFAQPECAIKGNISSSGERIYHDAGQVDGDVPEPDARHAFGGQTDPADAIPAFEHGIVVNA